jgi:hypothetical protein
MLIKLALNNEKAKQYNQRIRELRAEHPDFTWKEIEKLEDVFCPYAQIMRDKAWNNYKPIAKDNRVNVELHGVYVCKLNGNYDLESITDYKEVTNYDSPIYWWNYGVADNASQVLDYYDYLYERHSDYMNNRKFVILMTPIFREDQPEDGGWRWHKWGQYIGDFEPQCEYLYDEQGIDYVWVFNILEVEECKEELK